MKVRRTRVRKALNYLGSITPGKQFYVVTRVSDATDEALAEAGFCDLSKPGERVLPAPLFGPVSLFNAEGKEEPLKHLPKETVYHPGLFTKSPFSWLAQTRSAA